MALAIRFLAESVKLLELTKLENLVNIVNPIRCWGTDISQATLPFLENVH